MSASWLVGAPLPSHRLPWLDQPSVLQNSGPGGWAGKTYRTGSVGPGGVCTAKSLLRAVWKAAEREQTTDELKWTRDRARRPLHGAALHQTAAAALQAAGGTPSDNLDTIFADLLARARDTVAQRGQYLLLQPGADGNAPTHAFDFGAQLPPWFVFAAALACAPPIVQWTRTPDAQWLRNNATFSARLVGGTA